MSKSTKLINQPTKEILAKIGDLIGRAPIDWDKYHAYEREHPDAGFAENPEMKRTQQAMREAEALDRAQAPGLNLGRLVSWPVADGQAMYFVTRIGKRMVHLAHFPWGDSYRSPVVVNGQALRPAVEQAIAGMDGLRRIFREPQKP
ncbi:MAG: hypothetical protein ACREIC_19685 [Limisphaerales bacterium]